jgi:hypothetical protein
VNESPGSEIVDMIHVPCGEVVFRWRERPRRGDLADPARYLSMDGRRAAAGDQVWCLTCVRYLLENEIYPRGGWRR